jgi:hypothetical protein
MSKVAHSASLVRVLRALKREGCEIRKADGYFMASCPAHPDANPSMSVTHEGDRTLVHCFAGCDFEDIRAGLRLGAADFYDVRPGESDDPAATPDSDDPTSRLIDWEQLLSSAPIGADWLVYPLLEAGRATTLYAPAGEGKSLVSLEIAAGLASGRDAFRQPMTRMDVVYWDYENDAQLLASRVRKMGYKADDLKRLHYYSFPETAGLDTKAGAAEIVAAADRHRARLVVIDTYATSVDGEENSADTARGFAKYVVAPLKARSIASLRLDHTGKDITKGERGTSAKRGDVDYSWQILKTGAESFTFKNTKNRPGHAPPEFYVVRRDEPYLHHDVDDDLLAGMDPVSRIIAELDRFGLPLDVSRDQARAAGVTGKNSHITEAIKRRKDRATGT